MAAVSHRFDRVNLTDATRDLLIGLATADLDRPLDDACEAVTDWDELFSAICANGLLGVAQRYASAGRDAASIPAAVTQRINQAQAVSSVQSHAMLLSAGTVLRAIQDSGIATILLKGPALARLAYPHPSMRTFGDLDLMVRERDMQRMHALLVEHGFVPDIDLNELQIKLIPQCTTYEIAYVHPQTFLKIEIHFDDLLNAGLASRDLDGYWQRAVPFDINGVELKTLAPQDHLIHLCAHMHYHGYVRLNWFTDVALILAACGDQIDWQGFVATVRREEANVPVYYSLYYLQRLLGVTVPATVMSDIQPTRIQRRIHEYYLPAAKVCSLEPMPRPDFSFYFRPYFKRMLPDLLVMGRRREKLLYLLRLLAPPPAWLRRYYRLAPRQRVTPHYVLHPVKLALHAFRETRLALRSDSTWWNIEAAD
jgi:hypothetical protein